MITGIDASITIKDNVTGSYMKIPVIPQTIDLDTGDATPNTVNILKLGPVDFPNGTNLKTVGWGSFFPARYDPAYCAYASLLKPTEYVKMFDTWKTEATSLQIIIPALNVNLNVRLTSFRSTLEGFEGDISYTLIFSELRTIKPIKISTSAGSVTLTKTREARPAVPTAASQKTYTVKSGDTLIKIAKTVKVKDWRTIYNLNRDKIKSPNLIQPGWILKLP